MTLQFLDSTTISMAEIFLTVLTDRLAEQGEIWGEKPRLHTTGITFRRRESDKAVIPIVQTFVVLGGLYKNGNYYKVSPLGEMPGKYDYQHKLCFYSLNPSTYRKTCEQRIRDALSEIILHQRDYLPERMSGITVQQTNVAHEVSLQTSGNNAHSMLVVITPAIEGGGVPEGIRDSAARHLESQRACHPAWFLVPCSRRPSALQLWNITFEPLQSSLLQRAPNLQQTVLFLTWLSEKFGWGELGLPSSSIFNAIVFETLQVTGGAIAREKFSLQVTHLLSSFKNRLNEAFVEDYFVPKRNLLDVLSTESLANVKSEVDDVTNNLLASSGDVDEYIRSNYPYYIIRNEEETSTQNAIEEVFSPYGLLSTDSEGTSEDKICELHQHAEDEIYTATKVVVEEPVDEDDQNDIESFDHEPPASLLPAKKSSSRTSDGYFIEDLSDQYDKIHVSQTVTILQDDVHQIELLSSKKITNGAATVVKEEVFKENGEIGKSQSSISVSEKNSMEANNNVINQTNGDVGRSSPVPTAATQSRSFESHISKAETNSKSAVNVSNGTAQMINGTESKTSNSTTASSIEEKRPSPFVQLSESAPPLPPGTIEETLINAGMVPPGGAAAVAQPVGRGFFQQVTIVAAMGFAVVTIAITWIMSSSFDMGPQMFSGTSGQGKEL